MRNLQLLSCGSSQIPKGIFANDTDSGNVWVISDTLKLFCFRISEETCTEHADLSIECKLQCLDDVINLEYVLDLESVYFALSNGEIYKFSVESDEFDNVGSVDSGLECAKWSPDQEILVLVSREGKVILLTKNCDPISEASLLTSEFGEASPVALGWGKRETQFKGSAGKFADSKTDNEKSNGALSDDDRSVRISWRGDGQFFAVSFLKPSKGIREVKVFTRECVLHSTSESVTGLGQSLSWKPSANLITSSRTSHKEEIVFFERNGLRYGDFSLPHPVGTYKVREVEWNSNSTILLVWLQPLRTETETHLQLWSCSNAHWYLKQDISLSEVNAPVDVKWNVIHALTLHVLTRPGHYLTYEFRSVVTQNNELTPQNDGWIAVIDGSTLLLSAYRHLTVPPPMSSCAVDLKTPILEVAFGRGEFRNMILCLLADSSIAQLVHDEESKMDDSGFIGKVGKFTIAKRLFFILPPYNVTYHHMRQIHWLLPSKFLTLSYSCDAKQHQIAIYNVTEDGGILLISTFVTAKPILTFTSSTLSDSIAVQYRDGEVERVIVIDGQISTQPWVRLPYPVHHLVIASFGDKEHIVGLTNNGRLFVDSFELCSNSTSFYIHSQFLLITTSNHFLHCISTSTPLTQLQRLSPAHSTASTDTVRRIERGSVIVTGVSHDSKVVLQMPRGNLEVIHPRALILSIIANLLDSKEYAVAFKSLRKHRINMNVFHDYNPALFTSSIHTFITQVHQPQFLNIFISELSDKDVCSSMYPNMKKGASSNEVKDKVISLCDLIVETCERTEQPQTYFLPILTALIKKSPTQLEQVLHRIRDASNKTSQEEALKYVSLLIDMQQLYKEALATYDFEIMLLVAQQSNMDPKEYLPFLNDLNSMEVNYRKFSIDCHLSKYVKALEHILKCENRDEECLNFIQKHELYREALASIPVGDVKARLVSQVYGDWLMDKEKYCEAGLVFTQIKEVEKSLGAYRKSSNWRHVLSIAHQLNLSPDKLHQIVHEQVNGLKSRNETLAASQVLCEYTQDFEDAILMLIDGDHFNEAYRLVNKYSRNDLFETHLKPKLFESAQNAMSMLIKSKSDVVKFVGRLDIVLKKKLEREQNFFVEGGDPRDPDFFSEQSSVTGQSQTNSVSSRSSNKSVKSSRNRKKQERKKYRLKEGSAHEDLAILQEVREIVVSVDQLQEELNPMLELLIIADHTGIAQELQSAAHATIQYLSLVIPKVWSKHRFITLSLSLSREDGITSSPNLATGVLNALNAGVTPSQMNSEVTEPLIRTIKWEIEHLLNP